MNKLRAPLVLVALLSLTECVENQTEARTITVSGDAEVRVVPDEVILTLGVETWDKDLDAAKEENDDFSNTTSLIIKQLLQSCLAGRCFENLDSTPIPSQDSVAQIIQSTRRIMFPGYFTQSVIGPSNLEYCLHQEVKELLKLLSKQISLSILHNN